MKIPFALLTFAPCLGGCALAQNAPETVAAAPASVTAPTKISAAVAKAPGVPMSTMNVTVSVNNKSQPIRPDALGFNANFVRGGSYQDAALLKTIESLAPGHLRYPAGTLANYWDWRAGWVQKDIGKLPHGWSNLKPNFNTLEDLKIGVDATGATPLFVLNMLHSTLDNELEMLRAARKLGMPIKLVELGNEFYLSSPDYIEKFPTPESYGAMANEWAAKIKAEFPGVQIAAIGAATNPPDDERRQTWDEKLYPVLDGKNIDAITLHVYQGAGVGKRSKAMEATGLIGEAKQPKAKSDMWDSDEAQTEQWQQFQTDAGLTRMMSQPATRFFYLKELKTLPAGMEAWITEYNLFDRVGPVRGTWAHGLFAAMLPLNFVRNPKIQMLTYHDLYSGPTFGAIFIGKGGFDQLTNLIETAPGSPADGTLTAMGQTHRLLGRAMKGATGVSALEFADNPQVEAGRVAVNALFGRVFTAKGRRAAILTNITAQPFDLGKIPFAADARVTQISGDPRVYVTGPDSLATIEGALGAELKVPAYSMTLIEETTK